MASGDTVKTYDPLGLIDEFMESYSKNFPDSPAVIETLGIMEKRRRYV